MSTTTETIVWRLLPQAGLPDSDTTVLVCLDGDDDEPTWFGFWDSADSVWRNASTGGEFAGQVVKWADMPTGEATPC